MYLRGDVSAGFHFGEHIRCLLVGLPGARQVAGLAALSVNIPQVDQPARPIPADAG